MYNFNLTKKINLICILSIFFSCSNNETVGLENNDTILNGQWILNPAKKSSQKIVNISSEKVTSFLTQITMFVIYTQ